MQNDYGNVYYLRYQDDGSIYYLNNDGQYQPVEGEGLPQLLYVGDDGVAYFSKIQHQHTVYFSLDTHGDFDWVDYDDIPGYETPPPVDDEYEYPRVVEYEYGDEGWALIEMEDGRLIKYYDEGGAYYVDEYGNETAAAGFQIPTLLYVDNDGDAYFRVFSETEGGYRYYMIDVDGGVEYVNPYDIPGYEEPPVNGEYEYPRTVDWDDDEGWVIVQDEDGNYGKYYADGTEYEVDAEGNQLPPNGGVLDIGDLLYVDNYGNAYFQIATEQEGVYEYFMVDHDGGIEYVNYEDIPGYEDQEPPYDGHTPYFYDDYPNPFYGDLEADGDPTFANGVYTQTYNDGQVVVTWFNEGGPYRIRYYSEDGAGGYLELDITYDAYNYGYETSVYPYDYYDHIEDDFELPAIDHYVDYAYLGVPYDNMEISNTEVEYYWYDDDGDLVQKTTVDRVTGQITYEYDDLYIYVDQYGNETYSGNPDPNWMPPEGYEPPAGDLYPPYGMPPYLEFGDHQYIDPENDGYQLIFPAEPDDETTQWQFRGPNGELVIVTKVDDYTYQYAYQPDPNATPGDWEMVMNVTTDEYGNYVSYDAVDGEYYDEYYQGNGDYEGALPPGSPEYFGDPAWVNPEEDPRFQLAQTDTNDDGSVHHVYIADLDGDGDTDYKIDVVHYPDGHMEVEYHSDEYGHEATFEIITQPDGYYGTYATTYYVDDPQGVPEYEEPDYEYPRVVQWDVDENWAVLELENGQLVRYNDYRPPYYVDEQGNEITGLGGFVSAGRLVSVDENGNAYLQSGDVYYVIYPSGGFEEVDPYDIPGYDYEEPQLDEYEYPRTIQWDVDEGWAILEDEQGYHYKLYEDGQSYFVDQYGNETLNVGTYLPALVQVDAAGNAYVRQGEEGNYSYYVIDQDGGYASIDPNDIPDYDPNAEPLEEYYDADWADGYAPQFGYDHPHDLYGEPDPPGANQAPNVYLFGGGRAMVVHNADGSETITWYSEGGYQDGYIEYKATVEYDGGQWVTESVSLPTDLTPVYGILPVDGTPVYDPYHASQPYGDPDSITILEDRVIVTWDTDDGQVRSEWYRDGSHYREVRYPDGLVISGNGSEPWEYEIPDDWEPPVYDELDGYLPENAPDYFGDPMWANPETDERFEFQYEGHPQGADGPVTRTYHADVDGDGTVDYVAVVVENPDGSYYVDYGYPNGDWQARVTVEGNDFGNYAGYEITYYADDPEGLPPATNGAVTAPEEYDMAYVYDLLPDNLPAEFEGGYPNPEHSPGYQYHHTGEFGGEPVHFLSDGSSNTIVLQENADGSTTMYWFDRAVDELGPTDFNYVEARAVFYPDGQYDLSWYEDGQELSEPPGYPAEGTNGAALWEPDGYLPEGGPDYYVDERWPNPESDERFEFYQEGHPGSGAVTREYRADLDGDGQYDYRAIVVENPDGSVYVDYGYPNGDMEARITITQDEYGNYTDYDYQYYEDDPVGAVYYEEPQEDPAAAGQDYLPDWLPESFDGYPSPVQEGFEYQYTGTGDGNQNHYYTNGQYTIMVTDYGDGTGRVLIDDLSNGQGWDTGYDLYDYGQYAVMDDYVPDEPEPETAADDYLPDWLPYSFEGYPSPVQEGFEYQYTGTGDGNQNHYYTNGQYTIMVTDYGDGTGRVLIDDLSNGQGWDTGYDLYDYGQYSLMEEYDSDMQSQIAFVEAPEAEGEEETEDLEFTGDGEGAVEDEETTEPLSFNGPETGGETGETGDGGVEETPIEEEPVVTEVEPEPQPEFVEEVPLVTEMEDEDLLDDDMDDDGGL